MENNLKFNSQVATSRVQSERLLALGLKKETADMYLCPSVDGTIYQVVQLPDSSFAEDEIPAWSLHRLVMLMPKCVRAHSSGDDSPRLHPYVPKFDYQGVTIENIDEILAEFYQHTDLFGNIIDCIEWLIKEGYFNKEYLV